MKEPAYLLYSSKDALEYDFESASDAQVVPKRILFNRFHGSRNVFNLALVDVRPDGTLDDLSVSNNQDMRMVLATVVQALRVFFQNHPHGIVFFTGSTPARTRLYRAAIGLNLADAEAVFDVQGLIGNESEPFRPNRPYEAFVIRLKS